MATLTIDGIGMALQSRLTALALEHGTTASQEALRVMENALEVPPADGAASESDQIQSDQIQSDQIQTGARLYARIREAVARYGPLEIEIPPRGTSHRATPDFSQWPD